MNRGGMYSSNQPSRVSLSYRKLNRVCIIACKLLQVSLVHKHILVWTTHLDSGISGGGIVTIGIGISSSHLRGSIIAMILRVAARVFQIYDGEGICHNESSPVWNRLDNVYIYIDSCAPFLPLDSPDDNQSLEGVAAGIVACAR